jgi:sugar phosphate isomerase/epimerase
MRKLGLQLYTVRQSMAQDFLGVFKQVAEIGYAGVELGLGVGGLDVPALRALLAAHKVFPVTCYVPMELTAAAALQSGRDALDRMFGDIAALGAAYTGIAWMGDAYRNATGLARAADALNAAANMAARHGLVFLYHAHDFEFKIRIGNAPDSPLMLDALMSSTDPALVKYQLDTYWVRKGGRDVLSYINKYAGRIPVMHLKDMTRDGAEAFEIVGDGLIDFEAVFKAGDAAGVDWYIVEQDICPLGEVASARRSYENCVANGWITRS